jgi:trk system potassium uptake protein TrkH
MAETVLGRADWGAVFKYLGKVLIALSGINLVPAIVSIIMGEGFWIQFIIVSIVSFLAGYLLDRFLPEKDLAFREALIVASLAFLLPSFMLTFPMACAGYDIVDSFFEGMSAITTTGLSTFDPSELPKTFLFARALYQWIGGLGIAIITLSILIRPGTTAFKLFAAHLGKNKILPSVRSTARAIIIIYSILTATALILYLVSGLSLFDSIAHALTTVSTGGFSTKSSLPTPIILPSIILMFLSAQNFALYFRLWKEKSIKGLLTDIQFLSFITLSSIMGLLFIVSLRDIPNINISDAVLHIISASSTTGYSTWNLNELPDSSKFMLVILMLVGASWGSTGGGFKQYRLILALKGITRYIRKSLLPREVLVPIKVRGEAVEDIEVESSLALTGLYILVLIVTTAAFTLYGYPLSSSVFESASALATTGLSVGLISHGLQPLLKLLLAVNMWMGRLEILAVFALFYPRNWLSGVKG